VSLAQTDFSQQVQQRQEADILLCPLFPLLPAVPCRLQLTDLWANDNQIESLDEVEAALASQRGSLSCVYLRANPCAAGTDYKLRLKFALPKLEQLDDMPVA
jgi:hypothetical protein